MLKKLLVSAQRRVGGPITHVAGFCFTDGKGAIATGASRSIDMVSDRRKNSRVAPILE